jgi:Flp pilus assembly protein TadG
MTRHVNVIRQEKGTILVEATITMLVFLMLIFGIAEIGRLIQVQHALTNAAREGARFAIAPGSSIAASPGQLPSDAEIQTFVSGFLGSGILSSMPTIVTDKAATPGYTIVRITCQYQPMTGLFPFLKINLAGSSSMRNETAQ